MPTDTFRDLVAPDPANGILGDKPKASTFNAIHAALRNRPTYDEMQSPVSLQGVLDSTGDLPDDGNTTGDAYLVNGTVWVWDASAWTNQGSLTTGPQGQAATLTLKGIKATTGDLPASGNVVNDVWTVTADGHGYAWTADHEWVDIGGIQGPTGPAGTDGTDGDLDAAVGAPASGEMVGWTSGNVWGKIKPGRIDARVRGLSTASSNNSTLLATLATESGTDGSELWIPEGTYRGIVALQANTRINGKGTIKAHTGAAASHQAVIKRESAAGNMSISGITIDGNAEVGGVKLEGTGGATLLNTLLDGLTIQNTGTADNYDTGVRVVSGDTVTIQNCTFTLVDTAVNGVNSHRLRVLRNVVLSSRSNAFSYTANTIPYLGCEWVGNLAQNINRMGLEVLKAGGGVVRHPKVIGNEFYVAASPTAGATSYPFSIVGAEGAIIEYNMADAGSLTPSYCYEIGGNDHILGHNIGRGGGTGIATNNAKRVRHAYNQMIECITGYATVGGDANDWHTWDHDEAINCRDYGWNLGTTGTALAGHTLFVPIVVRDIAWSGDSGRTFHAISMEDHLHPTTFRGARIQQLMATPTLINFRFFAVFVAADSDLDFTVILDSRFVDFKSSGSTTIVKYFANAGGSTGYGSMTRSGNLMTDESNVITAADS